MLYFENTPGFLPAGEFYIDTGYDDPAGTSDNLAPAREFYVGQAFAFAMNTSNGNQCDIRIACTPTFSTQFVANTPTQSARVWLQCRTWISSNNRSSGSFVELTGVSWALYKL